MDNPKKNDITNEILDKKTKRSGSYDNELIKDNNNTNNIQINLKYIKTLDDHAFTTDSYIYKNKFGIFKSINEIFYIIYIYGNYSIISYNLITFQKVSEIKKAHDSKISFLRYYLDRNIPRDIIMSIACSDKNIKLWDIKNCQCIHNFWDFDYYNSIKSSCFINKSNQICIGVDNRFANDNIIIYDFSGRTIKTIQNSDNIISIENYFDEKLCKNYIIIGCKEKNIYDNIGFKNGHIISYDYDTGKKYHKYNGSYKHPDIIINTIGEKTLLIGASESNIKIWDFHSAKLLNIIKTISEDSFKNIFILNDNFLLSIIGSRYLDNKIKLIDIKKEEIVFDLINGLNLEPSEKYHFKCIDIIEKINHPVLGECLISQSSLGYLILWKM